MELKNDEFQALRLKVDQISSELDKQNTVRVVNTKWMLIVGAVILAALGYTSIFQLPKEATKAAMEKIGPEVIKQADKTMADLRQYHVDAEAILKRIKDASATTIPEGTLAFFNSDNCPEGWEEFKEGSGRFLIATGSDYSFGTKGGEKEVTLSLEEMPPHQHKNPVYNYGHMDPKKMTEEALQAGDKKGNYLNNPRPTDLSGGGKPHENMPPFLALTLCLKQ